MLMLTTETAQSLVSK